MPDNRSERAQRNVFPAKPLISRIKDAAGQRRQPVWKGKGDIYWPNCRPLALKSLYQRTNGVCPRVTLRMRQISIGFHENLLLRIGSDVASGNYVIFYTLPGQAKVAQGERSAERINQVFYIVICQVAIGLAQLGAVQLNDGCQVVIQTMIEPIMQRSQEQQKVLETKEEVESEAENETETES